MLHVYAHICIAGASASVCVCVCLCVCVCARPIEILTCGKVPYTSHVHTNGVFLRGLYMGVRLLHNLTYGKIPYSSMYIHMSSHTYAYGGGGVCLLGILTCGKIPYSFPVHTYTYACVLGVGYMGILCVFYKILHNLLENSLQFHVHTCLCMCVIPMHICWGGVYGCMCVLEILTCGKISYSSMYIHVYMCVCVIPVHMCWGGGGACAF